MRVIYMLSEDLNRTGSGIVHFMAVANGLRRLGHDVILLGPKYHRCIRPLDGFSTILLPVPGRSAASFVLFQLLAIAIMPLIVLLRRPDALLIRGGMGVLFLACWVARLLGVQVVLEINGVTWSEVAARGFSRVLARLVRLTAGLECRAAHRIIAVTPLIGEELIRCFGIARQRVFAIDNGADPEEFTGTGRQGKRAELGIAANRLVVGFIGDFSPWHGVSEIIDSAALLSAAAKREVVYLLVGAGEGWQEARERVDRAGLADVVLLPGAANRRQVADCLAAFDVGLYLTGRTEVDSFGHSPLKFWEYLAAGLPVVASDDASLTPLIRANRVGLVLAESSARHLAEAVETVLGRREEFVEIGRRNRQLVIERHSWLEVSRRVAAVLSGQVTGVNSLEHRAEVEPGR